MATDQYILCDDPTSVAAAVTVMNASNVIFLDCEGHTLGSPGGRLSLINCRASGQSFLIDVEQMTQSNFRDHLSPLFEVLSDPARPKVVYDGRMDFAELYHGQGVHLHNVLDLQVVDITSRTRRGLEKADQMARLRTYIPKWEWSRHQAWYKDVHKLNGLFASLKEFGIEFDRGGKVSHEHWMDRPLDAKLLDYAERDLRAIETLFHRFTQEGYIDSLETIAQSQRYIEVWIAGRPPKCTGHGLLPLNLIYPIQHPVGDFICRGCKRSLPLACKTTAKKAQCFVCNAYHSFPKAMRK